ncbi:MAG: alpha/beta fold hydrolase [Gammaproteobacteria bacterium]|nr:alpha/beta fold hydrolase [Gammaproteobacteria bacterium]
MLTHPPTLPPTLPSASFLVSPTASSLPLHHRVHGDPGDAAPPILLIHGLFGSAMNWHGIVGRLHRLLGASRRIIVPDLRNHGQSPHDPVFGYEAMAMDLAGLLDTLEIEHASLVGHSLGGKVAMWLALEHPERIAALVVVDIAPVTYPSRFRRLFAALRGLNLRTLASRREADMRLAADIPDPAMRGFLLQNLRHTQDGWTWRFNLTALADAMEGLRTFPDPQGRRFHGRTVFINGADSDYVRPDQLPAIQALFPRAQMIAIPGAGHWVHADQPEAFAEAIARLLGDSLTGPISGPPRGK